jgi:CheY-like chemotaxis protein
MEGPNQNELETSIPDKTIPEELSWLTSVPNDGPTVVTKVMDAVLNLAKHLADRSNVQLYCRQDENLPDLGMPSLALRHILLTLLNVLIPRARGKSVNISVYSTGKNLMIEIDSQDSSEQPAEVMDLSQKNLMVVNQITQLFGGSFTLLDNPGHFSARLAFPAIAKIPVLVIDDNPDSLLLLQRYASGTRYEVSGVHETDKAINLAEKLNPRVIFLDIMMPGVDGWEVLSQIRQQPLTSAIPVVVVSILPQESLALALGANAFLQKPINQKDFIDLLNQFVSEN